MKFIPYGRQWIDKEDVKAVTEVLNSDWLTQGPKVSEFEKALCNYTGAKYCVAVSNGTAALHIAVLSAGVKKGDELITSPVTFVASSNSALYCGAKPVFADISQDTVNIDPLMIRKKISSKTKAIIPVHFAGHPCDMPEISRIAGKNGLSVIEDAAHALGAEYKYKNKWVKVGSCRHSDMAILSFHPVKHITTGEGGAVLTNREDLFRKLLLFRSHGITKEYLMNNSHGPWYYEMQELGFNYRITDIQCALGVSQLKKLDKFVKRRREIADIYNNEFRANRFFSLPCEKENFCSSYHIYVIRLKKEFAPHREKLCAGLKARGIGSQVHYIPVYLQPYYQKLGFKKGACPEAEKYYGSALSIPIYPKMTDSEVKYVAKNLIGILTNLQ